MGMYKRPVALLILAASLILVVTGFWLWLGIFGAGRGGGIASLRHTLRDIHLYAGWAFTAMMVAHIACNARAMARHLGLISDAPRSHASQGTLRP
jgi:hypothetical protein